MQPRVILAGLATFTVGAAGGVVGARLVPGDVPLTPLSATPAVAEEIRIAAPAGGEDGIADLVDRVKVAVVNIDTVAHRSVPVQVDPFRYFFEGIPDGGMPLQQREEKGVGSGFVVAANGLIVTNHHVVRGADRLTVTFHDGKKFPGKVIGHDPGSDLALVRIEARNLSTLRLADPQRLRVGQYVVALGSPLGLSQTVTTGILSAINRDIDLNARVGFLQTDAPINPGNSGGPLLNLRGEVIGVNTAVAARGQGIGFAVPVDTLQTVLPQLEKSGRVARPWIGVGISNLPEDRSRMFYPVDQGVLVGRIEKGGPAAAAGLLPGDVIQSINGKPLQSANELIREVARHQPGETIDVLVVRQGQSRTVKLKLEKMPDQATPPSAEEE